MKLKYQKFKELNNQYEVSVISAANSFYFVITLFSLLILFFQTYNTFSNVLENYLLTELINVFTFNYQYIIFNVIPIFKINEASVLILLNLFYSSSRVINSMSKMSDRIYKVRPRNFIKLRVNSFLMFTMISFVFIIEIMFIVYLNKVLLDLVSSEVFIIIRVAHKILEFIVLFSLIILVYIYIPPVRMNIKKTYKGALLVSSLFYLVSYAFLIILKFLFSRNIGLGIAGILSFLFLWLFIINNILVWGIIYNYEFQME